MNDKEIKKIFSINVRSDLVSIERVDIRIHFYLSCKQIMPKYQKKSFKKKSFKKKGKGYKKGYKKSITILRRYMNQTASVSKYSSGLGERFNFSGYANGKNTDIETQQFSNQFGVEGMIVPLVVANKTRPLMVQNIVLELMAWAPSRVLTDGDVTMGEGAVIPPGPGTDDSPLAYNFGLIVVRSGQDLRETLSRWTAPQGFLQQVSQQWNQNTGLGEHYALNIDNDVSLPGNALYQSFRIYQPAQDVLLAKGGAVFWDNSVMTQNKFQCSSARQVELRSGDGIFLVAKTQASFKSESDVPGNIRAYPVIDRPLSMIGMIGFNTVA